MLRIITLCVLLHIGYPHANALTHNFDYTLYNQVPNLPICQVEKELDRRTQGKYHEFLRKVENLVKNYGLCNRIGLKYLHRHWQVKPGYAVIARQGTYHNTPAMISQCRKITKGDLPNSLFLHNGKWRVFEMIRQDKHIKETVQLLRTKASFFNKLQQLLQAYSLENYVGLVLTDNHAYQITTKGQNLFEVNHQGQSIIVPAKFMGQDPIKEDDQTKLAGWYFTHKGMKVLGCGGED